VSGSPRLRRAFPPSATTILIAGSSTYRSSRLDLGTGQTQRDNQLVLALRPDQDALIA